MKTTMLGLLAETPIHPGTGRSVGVVDLPVAREASTDYPVIVASGLKGALRDKAAAMGMDDDDVDARFGKPDRAGDLVVCDGRLLLLPVRSLTASFRWATCPPPDRALPARPRPREHVPSARNPERRPRDRSDGG